MTRAHVRKAAQQRGRKSTGSTPGWVYMLMGLAVGLAVAYAVYVNGNKQLAKSVAEPSDAAAPVADTPKAAAKPKPAPVVIADEPVPEGEVTYDFYNMLPSLDVELYEEKSESTAATAAPVTAVSAQGTYIIQAGSFSAFADANKRKGELGLLGVHSEIKAGDANGRTVYRVYTDPMNNPDDVNRTSALLAGQGIDILVKRAGD